MGDIKTKTDNLHINSKIWQLTSRKKQVKMSYMSTYIACSIVFFFLDVRTMWLCVHSAILILSMHIDTAITGRKR